MVESYSFGRIQIAGNLYTSDLIIFPDRIEPSWWRKTGHRLCLEDLREILEEKFDVLVVGTGYMGLMKIDDEVIRYAKSKGFDLIIETTKKAVQTYNTLSPEKKTIAAFHLTC